MITLPDKSESVQDDFNVNFSAIFGRSPKVLWIVSAGGHLAQAHRIEQAIGQNVDSVWVTFDVSQSRSLLHGRRVEFVDYVAPRDLVGAVKASHVAARLARSEQFDFCVSTGAAVAGIALPRVAAIGVPTAYVESIARSMGPSLTGKFMRRAPGVTTLTQYRSWANRNWLYSGSILDHTLAEPIDVVPERGPRRIFITLGTIRPYRFDRAVDAVLKTLSPLDQPTWQLGSTTRDDLPGDSFSELTESEMEHHIAASDVVVTHAGVGSILTAHRLGKIPVLAIREREYGEHVDDHQWGIAEVMSSRGLAYILNLGVPARSVFESATRVVATERGS